MQESHTDCEGCNYLKYESDIDSYVCAKKGGCDYGKFQETKIFNKYL